MKHLLTFLLLSSLAFAQATLSGTASLSGTATLGAVVAPSGGAPFTLVSNPSCSSSASATTCAATVTIASGKLLVVGTMNNGTRTVSSITSGACTGAWAQVASAQASNSTAATDMWWCVSSASFGTATLTVTFSGIAGTFEKDWQLWVMTPSGTPAIDTQGVNSGATTSASVLDGGTVTPTITNGFIAAVSLINPAQGVTGIHAGNEFTLTGGAAVGSGAAAHLLNGAISAHLPKWDVSGDSFFAASTVAFK